MNLKKMLIVLLGSLTLFNQFVFSNDFCDGTSSGEKGNSYLLTMYKLENPSYKDCDELDGFFNEINTSLLEPKDFYSRGSKACVPDRIPLQFEVQVEPRNKNAIPVLEDLLKSLKGKTIGGASLKISKISEGLSPLTVQLYGKSGEGLFSAKGIHEYRFENFLSLCNFSFLDKEAIENSGVDTFQKYLKERLTQNDFATLLSTLPTTSTVLLLHMAPYYKLEDGTECQGRIGIKASRRCNEKVCIKSKGDLDDLVEVMLELNRKENSNRGYCAG